MNHELTPLLEEMSAEQLAQLAKDKKAKDRAKAKEVREAAKEKSVLIKKPLRQKQKKKKKN